MAFNSRQKWQYDKSTLTLIDQLTEGKFASIYEASISGLKGTAVVKMLRCKSELSALARDALNCTVSVTSLSKELCARFILKMTVYYIIEIYKYILKYMYYSIGLKRKHFTFSGIRYHKAHAGRLDQNGLSYLTF